MMFYLDVDVESKFFYYCWVIQLGGDDQIDNNQLEVMGETQKQQTGVDMSDVENGPLTEAQRQCRDIFCCLLFIGCIGGMVYLTYFGYAFGDPYKAFRGINQDNEECGKVGGLAQNYPYLYFHKPSDVLGSRICVEKCPTYDSVSNTVPQVNTRPTKTWDIQYDSSATLISTTGTSVVWGYDSTLTIDRVCIPNPNMFTTLIDSSSFASAITQGDLSNFIQDIKNNWKWLLAGLGWAVLISFVFMFLLRCLAGCIVWCSLFGIIFFFIGLGLIFLYNAGYLGAASGAATYMGVPSWDSTKGNNQVYGWISIGLGCFFFILVLCCCSRLRLAVAVCKSAGQFVAGVCTSVLVPIIQSLVSAGVWAACLVVMVYLVSSAEFVAGTGDYFTSIKSYEDYNMIRFYCFVFGTLWVNAFIGAMTIFIIASACTMWYYSHGPDQELTLPIARSYKMVFRFHFGSLAFGALLVAIVQFLQLVVEAVKRQAEASGQKSKCFEYIIKCLQCFLACVECIVKFINTQAYIQIAIRGKNFCYAAKDGFELAWSNAMRYAIVGGVGQIIMFLGKLMIAALSAGGFYILITYVDSIRSGYQQPFYQVILIGVIGYAVSVLFMSVYTIAMDTLLVCFIVDENNNKGKGKKAVHAPQDLADLMETD